MPGLVVTQADNGKSFEVHQGEVIGIRLEENPSTGYRWAIDHVDADFLTLQNSAFSPTSGGGIGSGGERTFTFKATKTGTAHIQLKLWREWEGDRSITNRYTLTIQIRN
jgi:inhibitor of cysteine peptidase